MSMVSGQNSIEGVLKLKASHLLQAFTILIVSLAMLTQLLKHDHDISARSLRADVTHTGIKLQSRLEDQLATNIHLAEGLAATFIGIPEISKEQIDQTIEALYLNGNHLKNIGVAPGNRLTNVYPIETNLSALGIYYPDLPSQWPGVKAAIDSKQSMLVGPVKLVQGGVGLINRKPVFLNDGSYWGIINLVLDMEALFADAGFREAPEGLILALFKKDDTTGSNEFVYGTSEVSDKKPVYIDLNIPGNHWQLALAPSIGWQASLPSQLPFEALGFFVCLLISMGFLAFRTVISSLRNKDANMRSILIASRDSIIVLSDSGHIMDANPATEKLFGYSVEALIGEKVNELFYDEASIMEDLFQQEHRIEQFTNTCYELSGKHKQGEEFAMEVSIGKMGANSKGRYVCVMRDITERKIAEATLVKLASTDSLTGAMNRRAFMSDGEKLFSIAKRFNRTLSVLTLDADHFKNINDTYGHDVGDQVLIAIVETLKLNLRRVDLISRFGGEEFMVLLPETDEGKAMMVAEKLRKSLAALNVSAGNNCVLRFTCSIGYTTLTDQTVNLAVLLQEADQALYQAKSSGRNQSQNFAELRENQNFKRLPGQNQLRVS